MNAPWIPARAGDALMDVDTPALILDLDRFEANLLRLMSAVKGHDVSVRPHSKSHKCVEIARRQVAAGAIGICCQKTSEAEPFLAGGIRDVLITNEVVGDRKTLQLAQLAARYPGSRVGVCVDDSRAVDQVARACEKARAKLDVYIELDVGHNRAGVTEVDDVVALGRAIASASKSVTARIACLFRQRAASAQHCRAPPGDRRCRNIGPRSATRVDRGRIAM